MLLFLRFRKYSLVDATKCLENYLTTIKFLPQYFENIRSDDLDLMELIDAGYVLAMPERTANGELILMGLLKAFDTKKFNIFHVVRSTFLISACMLEEHESQIAGFVAIYDASELSMEYIAMHTWSVHKNISRFLQNFIPVRLKSIYIINLPKFLVPILNSLTNDKMKTRIHFCKDVEDLKPNFDTSLLLKEYGGKYSMAETVENIKEKISKRKDIISQTFDVEIDVKVKPEWACTTETDEGVFGSFRKLEID